MKYWWSFDVWRFAVCQKHEDVTSIILNYSIPRILVMSNSSIITPAKCTIFFHYPYILCYCYMFRYSSHVIWCYRYPSKPSTFRKRLRKVMSEVKWSEVKWIEFEVRRKSSISKNRIWKLISEGKWSEVKGIEVGWR
jgi:hypothetical protein